MANRSPRLWLIYSPMHRCIPLIVCILAQFFPAACTSNQARSGTVQPTPIKNLHILAPGLYSGDEPATAAHYDQLSSLGIKTVISVDAIAPDPGLAAKHNIRIVHLPIGYDGIKESRAIELSAAITQLEHPIYLHCHHGKHRGPAAIGVGAIGAGVVTSYQAIEFMTIAGTSPSYPGLYTAARNAKLLDQATLDSVHEFPTRTPISGFVESMGKLDRLHDQLWDIAENDWQASEYHPDLSATAISGQVYDHMRAMLGLDFFKHRGSMMRSRFEDSIQTAGEVESKINDHDFSAALDALNALNKSCIDCHNRFRN